MGPRIDPYANQPEDYTEVLEDAPDWYVEMIEEVEAIHREHDEREGKLADQDRVVTDVEIANAAKALNLDPADLDYMRGMTLGELRDKIARDDVERIKRKVGDD